MIASQLTPALLAALLSLFPRGPAHRRIAADRARVLADARAALDAYAVPPEILLAVGFRETWLGTHPHEGHGWGAPRDRAHRHLAGTATDAARVLEHGYQRCGSWHDAAAYFRSGQCRGDRAGDAYADATMRLAGRLRGAMAP